MKLLQFILFSIVVMTGLVGNAQTVVDTLKVIHINPDLQKMIHFNGYQQKRSNDFVIIDSLKFNGIKTIKQLTVKEFMRLTQADADRYNKEMESIYEPLKAEQQRIIDEKNRKEGKGLGIISTILHYLPVYNPGLGYSNPMAMPVELLNPNMHEDDKYKAWEAKEEEMMEKYKQK